MRERDEANSIERIALMTDNAMHSLDLRPPAARDLAKRAVWRRIGLVAAAARYFNANGHCVPPSLMAQLERSGRRRARGRAMTAAVFAFLGYASLAAAQARPQEYRFAGLQWGASETEVRNALTLKQFRRIAPTVNGQLMVGEWWAGELLGLRVTVGPLLVQNQLVNVWVEVRPSGTMSSKAMVDSVRRVLVRDYGEPRVVAPGILSWLDPDRGPAGLS